MVNHFATAWASLDAGLGLGILADEWLKGFLILGVTWLCLRLARRRASATRHLAWCLAMTSLLLLPVLSWILPAWRLAVLPAPTVTGGAADARIEPARNGERSPHIGLAIEPVSSDNALTLASGVPPSGPVSRALKLPDPDAGIVTRQALESKIIPRFAYREWMVAGWVAIAALLLIPSALGHWLAYRLCRRARPLNDRDWRSLAGELGGQLGLRRRVELRQCGALTMPLAWGWWRPTILLPGGAGEWPEAWRRAVLLHELAHVKRWDCFTQTLAQLACALHWPNPLAWLAVRRMGLEREQACDDLVLNAGARPAEYAGQLLDFTRSLRHEPYIRYGAIAMACPSTLERRVRAILDRTRNRRGLTRTLITAGLVSMAGIAGPAAAIKLIAKSPASAPAETPVNSASALGDPKPSLAKGLNTNLAAPTAAEKTNAAPATPEHFGSKEYFVDFPPRGELPRFSRMLVEQQLGRAVGQKLYEHHYHFNKLLANLSVADLQVSVTIEGLRRRQETNGLTRETPLSGRLIAKFLPDTGHYRCLGEDALDGLDFEVPVILDIDMQLQADPLFRGNAKWDLGIRELKMNLEDRTSPRGYWVGVLIISNAVLPAYPLKPGTNNAAGK